MANVVAPSGFSDGRLYNGSSPNYATREVRIAYNLSNQIGYGDPVKLLNTGYIDRYAATDTTIHGIFIGCEYLNPAIGRWNWYPAWTAPTLTSTSVVLARVIVDPFATFQCQVIGGPLIQTDLNTNFDITAGTSGAPNAQSGISTCSIAYGAGSQTTSTLPFRLVGIVQFRGGSILNSGSTGPVQFGAYDPTAANNWGEFRMNTSDSMTPTGI